MHKALIDILGSLPDETKVFCGHEYSLQNLKFAAHVEPENEDVKKKIAWSQKQREEKKPTVSFVKLLLVNMTDGVSLCMKYHLCYHGCLIFGSLKLLQDQSNAIKI